MPRGKLVLPKPPHRVHKRQKWLVGQRVRVTKLMEPALKRVPKHRLTATGTISFATLRFARTPEMAFAVYHVALDTEILGEKDWAIGYDLRRRAIELTQQGKRVVLVEG